jgi:hypothetical protein
MWRSMHQLDYTHGCPLLRSNYTPQLAVALSSSTTHTTACHYCLLLNIKWKLSSPFCTFRVNTHT